MSPLLSGKRAAGILPVITAIMLGFPAVSSADTATQIDTAISHAGLAQKAEIPSRTHVHLYHVINCLEGSLGKHFNQAVSNPCEDAGSGILTEVTDNAAAREFLETARDLALTGVQINLLMPARKTASAVSDLLEAAQKSL